MEQAKRETYNALLSILFMIGSGIAAGASVFAAYHGETDRFIALVTLSGVLGLVAERKQ